MTSSDVHVGFDLDQETNEFERLTGRDRAKMKGKVTPTSSVHYERMDEMNEKFNKILFVYYVSCVIPKRKDTQEVEYPRG